MLGELRKQLPKLFSAGLNSLVEPWWRKTRAYNVLGIVLSPLYVIITTTFCNNLYS